MAGRTPPAKPIDATSEIKPPTGPIDPNADSSTPSGSSGNGTRRNASDITFVTGYLVDRAHLEVDEAGQKEAWIEVRTQGWDTSGERPVRNDKLGKMWSLRLRDAESDGTMIRDASAAARLEPNTKVTARVQAGRPTFHRGEKIETGFVFAGDFYVSAGMIPALSQVAAPVSPTPRSLA